MSRDDVMIGLLRDIKNLLAERQCRPAVNTAPPPMSLAEYEARLSLPLSALDLSVRCSNALEMTATIQTVRDLLGYGRLQLLALRHVGATSMKEISTALGRLGFKLGD